MITTLHIIGYILITWLCIAIALGPEPQGKGFVEKIRWQFTNLTVWFYVTWAIASALVLL
jgi:hypothetical protein